MAVSAHASGKLKMLARKGFASVPNPKPDALAGPAS